MQIPHTPATPPATPPVTSTQDDDTDDTPLSKLRQTLNGGVMSFLFSYILPRVIAMSFPSKGLESLYRNRIQDVANYLESKHKDNYLIINVSDRTYDTNVFKNQVSFQLYVEKEFIILLDCSIRNSIVLSSA